MGERRKEVRRVEKGEGEGRQEESGGEVGWGIRERGEQRWMDGGKKGKQTDGWGTESNEENERKRSQQ